MAAAGLAARQIGRTDAAGCRARDDGLGAARAARPAETMVAGGQRGDEDDGRIGAETRVAEGRLVQPSPHYGAAETVPGRTADRPGPAMQAELH